MMNLLVTIGKKQHHLSVKPGTPLPEALALLGFPIALPCGGKGSCGKCRVKATGQLSPITPAERRCLSAGELRNGLRLLCQTAVLGEARIELPEESAEIVVEGVSAMPQNRPIDGKALCAALDIGTTTVAARLYVAEELESSPIASAGRRNPQAAFGADVLSRMERAQAGGCTPPCGDASSIAWMICSQSLCKWRRHAPPRLGNWSLRGIQRCSISSPAGYRLPF